MMPYVHRGQLSFLTLVFALCLLPSSAAAQEPPDDPGARWLGVSDFGAWSPDSRTIVFHSTRDGNFEIYVMNADGSEQRRLTRNPWADFWPAFSTDGTEIAFTSDREGWVSSPSRNQIYLMNRDGTNVRQLTDESYQDDDPLAASSNNLYPLFHPDGWIAFLSDRGNGWHEIYAVERDGSNARRLTYDRRNHFNPFFSPDGTMIFFDAHKDGYPTAAIRDGGWELHAVASTGGPIRNLSDNLRYEDYDGTMSPDGSQIIYNRSGHPGLFLMNADGSGQTDEAWYEESAFSPRWSPDGTRLLFTSTRDGHRELYVMELSTRQVTRLTWSR
jgi:Tol biopolymer transport system component